MPRIKLIEEKSDVAADQHAEIDAIVETLGRVAGPFGVLAYSPGLAQKVMEAGAHVRLKSSLTMGEREMTILAVSREKDARYEWASHVNTARNNDVPEDAIEAVRHSSDVSELSEDYRDIVTYVRQLLQTNKVDQVLFDSMIKRKGIRWVVEITATAGQYQYISAINNAFDLQPAADADQLEIAP
jgi:alkylhydroperoxidase family enzyme